MPVPRQFQNKWGGGGGGGGGGDIFFCADITKKEIHIHRELFVRILTITLSQ